VDGEIELLQVLIANVRCAKDAQPPLRAALHNGRRGRGEMLLLNIRWSKSAHIAGVVRLRLYILLVLGYLVNCIEYLLLT